MHGRGLHNSCVSSNVPLRDGEVKGFHVPVAVEPSHLRKHQKLDARKDHEDKEVDHQVARSRAGFEIFQQGVCQVTAPLHSRDTHPRKAGGDKKGHKNSWHCHPYVHDRCKGGTDHNNAEDHAVSTQQRVGIIPEQWPERLVIIRGRLTTKHRNLNTCSNSRGHVRTHRNEGDCSQKCPPNVERWVPPQHPQLVNITDKVDRCHCDEGPLGR
mmetsp:Transcript_20378/g.42244  ORF Transcript_20378/g.42244 Transcript_20378/m.42244 type:complete len:212 (-) Transcript_20378:315-950(-)